MFIADAHCDTLLKLLETQEKLSGNSCHLDLAQNDYSLLQVFAQFIDPEISEDGFIQWELLMHEFERQLAMDSSLCFCTDGKDIPRAVSEKKNTIVLSVENAGDAMDPELKNIDIMYRHGVRIAGLVWNYDNKLCGGTYSESNLGLTDLGKKFIYKAQKKGIVIDVSHMNEIGFCETLEISVNPIIATHSCVYEICRHPRNLKDFQMNGIKAAGGLIGICFYPEFLNESGHAQTDDIIRHIEYSAALIGCGNICFGSDFDGVDELPVDIKGSKDTIIIIEKMLKLNYKEADVKKIAGENLRGFLENNILNISGGIYGKI